MSVIGEAFVKLRPDTTTFRAESVAGIKASLAGAGLGAGGGALAGLATKGNVVAASLAAVALGLKTTAGEAAAFEVAMNTLDVVSGATDAQMQQLSDTAKQLGSDLTLPNVSAQDAATAELELAKAGLSVRDSLAGARGVLQLASAGQIEVGEAARIAGSALNAFGLSGDQATHVADLLAGASIAAQGEVSDMAASLQQSSAVARQFGLSIEDTVGAITLLAKNGILGSDAGTSLRTTLQRLIPTSEEAAKITDELGIRFDDAQGNILPLTSIIGQYQTALDRLTPSLRQQIITQVFGSDAARAASILIREGTAGIEAQTRAADRAGAANDLASAKTKGLSGAVAGLKSNVQTLGLELGQITAGPLTDFFRGLSTAAGGVTSLVREIKKIGGVELPGFLGGGGVGDQIKTTLEFGLLGPFGVPARIGKKAGETLIGAFTDGADTEFSGGVGAAGGPFSATSRLTQGLTKAALGAGVATGKTYGLGVAKGLVSQEQAAVDAAHRTLAEVIRQGKAQVAQAIVDAQRNLTQIGSSLADQAAQAIDVGPIADRVTRLQETLGRATAARQRLSLRQALTDAQDALRQAVAAAPIQARIEQLQALLDRRQSKDAGTDLRRTLRDAQTALREGQDQAQLAGPLTARQLGARAEFLRPLREAVSDARSDLRDFGTKTTIEGLQARLAKQADDAAQPLKKLRDSITDARTALSDFDTNALIATLQQTIARQKESVRKGIADIIDEFQHGKIGVRKLSQEIAATLAAAHVDYRAAGERLGTAAGHGFETTFAALVKQARAAAVFPRTGQGAAGDIVSPADVKAQAQRSIGAARADQMAKQNELTTGSNRLLEKIHKALTEGARSPTAAKDALVAPKGLKSIVELPRQPRAPVRVR